MVLGWRRPGRVGRRWISKLKLANDFASFFVRLFLLIKFKVYII
jgi:hypothetical protein